MRRREFIGGSVRRGGLAIGGARAAASDRISGRGRTAADEVRAGDQCEDRQNARPRCVSGKEEKNAESFYWTQPRSTARRPKTRPVRSLRVPVAHRPVENRDHPQRKSKC